MRNHRADSTTPLYEHTATAGLLRRPATRRALCAAQDTGLIAAWAEPAPGYFRILSAHAALEISPA